MYFSRFHALMALAFSILVTGCASPYPHVEEDFQTNWQSQEYNAQVHLLPSAPEALARRIDLVRNATKSIDLTYFSWDKDTVGLLLVNELKLAADRGVKVRLVLDDLLVFNEKWLAEANQHANIEIKLFNPFHSRKSGWLGRSGDFMRHQQDLDHRLHEKYFNVDHHTMILGGRNIGDAYFGYSQSANFFDMDTLFKGEILKPFASNYEVLWTSEHVMPIESQITVKANAEYKALNKALNKVNRKHSGVILDIENNIKRLKEMKYIDVVATPVFDSLEKLKDQKPYFRARAEVAVEEELANAQQVTISTPYIVPSQSKFDVIERLTSQGTQVSLYTNSSASNDSLFIPAYYKEHRQTLLDLGVEIHEYRDQAVNEDHFFHVDTYYHNKTLIIDDEVTYIGSSNFDPRSDFLNVEFGVFIRSPTFAQDVHHYLAKQKESIYWQVTRDDSGNTVWQSGEEHHVRDPNYSGWHKIPDWIFKKMDGEFEL
ncbi:phospholipase [Vibrio astriarenae]|uniref:Phospholipase n=1 Tax=Vibrio astriarenae TaxID=1481923 RepID=A0A7Z2T7L3_9VIBR|nr:phospholipase D family protein [Vibrio astriarenae]QIA65708.1 phospholipase [Vibrio astriarenae]